MERRAVGALVAGAIIAACAWAAAAPAGASATPHPALHGAKSASAYPHAVAKKGKLCNNTGDPVVDRLSSQQFEASYGGVNDTLGATDCEISRKAKILGAVAPGQDSNDPMTTANFVTYADAGGLPGETVNSQVAHVTDDAGTLSVATKPFKLKQGIDWFTVQAIHDYLPDYSQWFWFTTDVPRGNRDQWENPGGGYEICPTWCGVTTLDGHSTDFLFKLLGKGR